MTARLRAGDLQNLLGLIETNRMSTGASSAETVDLLRRWSLDQSGHPIRTAYLLGGAPDSDGRDTLPSFEAIQDNYRTRTGGEELAVKDLLELGPAGAGILAGISVTASDGPRGLTDGRDVLQTIWNRNHNYWVDKLKSDTGGKWTEDEYFEAARAINIAEHQQAAFGEIAKVISGNSATTQTGDVVVDGLAAGDALLSMFSERVNILDGDSGVPHQLALADAFKISDDFGANGAAPTIKQSAILLDVLPGSRTGLPGRSVDLASVYSGRSARDQASIGLNQVRDQLFAITGLANLRPYDGWTDFQERNELSDDVIADLEAAYPDGFAALDLWVGGLAEKPVQGQFGSTLGVIASTDPDLLPAASQSNLATYFSQSEIVEHIGSQSFASLASRHLAQNSAEHEQLFGATQDQEVLNGTEDDDLLVGGVGDDMIFGDAGDDVIFGGDGEDFLAGGLGNDVIEGGKGDDIIYGDGATDSGNETSENPASVAETIRVVSAGGDDYLSGGAGNDIIYGGGGNDTLLGGTGTDKLLGGSGKDHLDGGEAADVLQGGTGDDTYVVSDPGDIVIEFVNGGTDTVIATVSEVTLSVNVENLEYAGSGSFIGVGNLEDNTIIGGSGADVLIGLTGNDILIGGLGDDTLVGGDDVIAPNAPELIEITGSSSDEIILGSTTSDEILAGSGDDTIFGGAGSDTIDGGRDADYLDGGSGSDTLSGGRGDDVLLGGSGDDSLDGGSGHDELYGGEGNDELRGGSGDDNLCGGDGDDRLEGGSGYNYFDGGRGDDWLISISGNDTIVLREGFGNDYVVGFDADSSGHGGQNRIDVSDYGLTADALGIDIVIHDLGDHTAITIGSDTLTLLMVNASTIDRKDFIFD